LVQAMVLNGGRSPATKSFAPHAAQGISRNCFRVPLSSFTASSI